MAMQAADDRRTGIVPPIVGEAMSTSSHALIFGNFRLVPSRGELTRDGVPIVLGSRALALLQALAERPGEIVGKQALLDLVWPDVMVEESNLTVQISALRRALGDTQDGRGWIATVPGRGYRFLGAVSKVAEPPPTPPQAPHPAPRSRHYPRRALLLAGGAAVALGAGLAIWRRNTPSIAADTVYFPPEDRRQSVVILPLDPLVQDVRHRETAKRMTEMLTGRLTASLIAPRETADAMKASGATAAAIARQLDVHFAISGTVRVEDDRLVLTIQVVEARDDRVIWRATVPKAPSGSPETERWLIEVMARGVQTSVNLAEIRLSAGRTLDARDHMIRGTAAFGSGGITRRAVLTAVAEFEQALRLSPRLFPALFLASRDRCYSLLYGWSTNPQADRARTEAELAACLEMAPNAPFPMLTRALLLFHDDRQEDAIAALERLAEFRSSEIVLRIFLGKLRALAGRLDDAAMLLERACRDDAWGDWWDLYVTRAAVHLARGEDAAAAEWARRAADVNAASPDDTAEALAITAASEAWRGRAAPARAALRAGATLSPPIPRERWLARRITPRLDEGVARAAAMPDSG
jgi:DNA-binding winged helix-turn-helix (wHTH) protein/TolB-like protein